MLQFLFVYQPLWKSFGEQMHQYLPPPVHPPENFQYHWGDRELAYMDDRLRELKEQIQTVVSDRTDQYFFLTVSGYLYLGTKSMLRTALWELHRGVSALYGIGNHILYLTTDHHLILRRLGGTEAVLSLQVYGIKSVSLMNREKPYSVVHTTDDQLYHITRSGAVTNRGPVIFYVDLPTTYLYTTVRGWSFLNGTRLKLEGRIAAVSHRGGILNVLTEDRSVYLLTTKCSKTSVLTYPASKNLLHILFSHQYQHFLLSDPEGIDSSSQSL